MRQVASVVLWAFAFAAMIQVSASAAILETVIVDSSSMSPVESSSVLEKGQRYLLEVSGEFGYDTVGKPADAEWSWNGAEWIEIAYDPVIYPEIPDQLDLLVRETAVDWWGTENGETFSPHTFSPSHVYRLEVPGEGERISFRVEDAYHPARYSDNRGSLTVDIHLIPEPSSVILWLGMAVTGLLACGWRRKRR